MSPSSETEQSIAVFAHTKRKEWGLGLLAWETKGKRGYVFENGRLRVVAEPFYELMQQVAFPIEDARALVRCLKPELDAARAQQGPSARVPRSFSGNPSVEDQIAIFRAEFPAGFADARWLEKYRRSTKKRARTHREPAILAASEKLGQQSLTSRIRDQAFRGIHEDVIAILQQTDLVPASELALITSTDQEHQRAISQLVAELLHGKAEFNTRFGHFLAGVQHTTNKPAGWHLATALPALLQPQEHICVRPTSFRVQAKSSAPSLSIPKHPNTSSYSRCLAMVKQVSTKLTEAGEAPQDLMDVTDFIHFSAQSVARERLVARKHALP